MNIETALELAIKKCRKFQQKTQGEIADNVGIPQSQLSMLERGCSNKRVNLCKLEKIAKAVGLDSLTSLIYVAERLVYPDKQQICCHAITKRVPINWRGTEFTIAFHLDKQS